VPEFEEASSARTVWAPLVEPGTVNEALNEPVGVVEIDRGEVVRAVPSYLTVIVEDPVKPVPETVTVEPMMPFVELRVIAEMMLKLEDAEFDDESVASTVWAP